MIAVALVYAGLIIAVLGGVSIARPLAFLGIRTRPRGTFLLGLGLVSAGVGCALPAGEMAIAVPQTRHDEFMPAYHFNEVHTIRVTAPTDRVYRAIKAVTADEILFFRLLVWTRRLGRPGPESILSPPEHIPLLEVATRTTFLLLAEEPDREIVIGTVVLAPAGARLKAKPTPDDFKSLDRPGFAKATMSFLVQDAGPGASLVTTETRVYATDPPARRRFAVYWRVISPGSALIRRMWLRAVKLRAEAAGL